MNRKWLAAKAVVFGLSMLAGAALIGDVLGDRWAGLLVLTIGAVRGGMDFYEHGLMTPVPAVDRQAEP